MEHHLTYETPRGYMATLVVSHPLAFESLVDVITGNVLHTATFSSNMITTPYHKYVKELANANR